jgi:hypothetical protein
VPHSAGKQACPLGWVWWLETFVIIAASCLAVCVLYLHAIAIHPSMTRFSHSTRREFKDSGRRSTKEPTGERNPLSSWLMTTGLQLAARRNCAHDRDYVAAEGAVALENDILRPGTAGGGPIRLVALGSASVRFGLACIGP